MKYLFSIFVLLTSATLSAATLAKDAPIDVPFAKVMNPGTAPDYQRKAVKTKARFMAPGNTEGWIWIDIPPQYMNKKVVFRVTDINNAAQMNIGVPPHIFIEKDKSDLVFELQPGEEIVLIGHPVVGQNHLGATGPASTQIIFVAESVQRVTKGARK